MKITATATATATATVTVVALAALVGPLLLAGCDVHPRESAVAGAAPAVAIPVGPIPGPGEDPVLPQNPYARDPIALMQGRKLFVWYNCAGCHGGHGGGGMGPSLRDVTWIYGETDAHIFDSIAEGRAYGMPAWGTKVPIDHIWKITAYIDSMGTPLEPKPPIVTEPHVDVPAATNPWEGTE